MTNPTTPYATLGPDQVLDAIESLGLPCDGRQLALNSYENRVYQVGIDEDEPIVAKFYRPGRWSDEQIGEEHEFALALAKQEIPVVAPLMIDGRTLHQVGEFRIALYLRRGGRTPELGDPEVLEWLGRFIGRIHLLGASKPFEHRPSLNIHTFGHWARSYLVEQDWIPRDLKPAWESVSEHALQEVAACFERAGNVDQIRLHGDCHAGNLMWTDAGPHFVDLDDARTGPSVQDLWLLLSGDRRDQAAQLSDILAGYEDFREFDRRELHLVEALRTLRLLHYSAWLAQRWQDPAFPAAFPWFNTQRYWEEKVLELREQIALMQEPVLVV